MNTPIRIAIADDHLLFRQGLKSLLQFESDVTVVAETESVGDIAPMLARTPADILLLDLLMDRNALIEVESLAEHIAVIIVTATDSPEDLLNAVKKGAHAVVFKHLAVETLMEAIRAVAQGLVWLPPSLQSELTRKLWNDGPDPLTRREREIVHYVALGLRNAEVARKLFISQLTVKTHLNKIFQKVGVRDRVELALYAARVGIIGVHERAQP